MITAKRMFSGVWRPVQRRQVRSYTAIVILHGAQEEVLQRVPLAVEAAYGHLAGHRGGEQIAGGDALGHHDLEPAAVRDRERAPELLQILDELRAVGAELELDEGAVGPPLLVEIAQRRRRGRA